VRRRIDLGVGCSGVLLIDAKFADEHDGVRARYVGAMPVDIHCYFGRGHAGGDIMIRLPEQRGWPMRHSGSANTYNACPLFGG